MTKLINKISVPLISSIFLLSMSGTAMAETTVSAENSYAVFASSLALI